VVDGVRSLPVEPINRLHLDSGFLICNSCNGAPNQYEIDFEERCPECDGAGFVSDPDYIDGDAREFDPHSEWGTERHHRRHV
jgi:hypothetical protein